MLNIGESILREFEVVMGHEAYGSVVASREPYVQAYKLSGSDTLQIISMINYSLNQKLYINSQQLVKAGSLPSTLRKFASSKLYCSLGDLNYACYHES